MAKKSLKRARLEGAVIGPRGLGRRQGAASASMRMRGMDAALAIVVSLLLVFSFLPLPSFAITETSQPPKPTASQIQEMLSGKDYVEGEVIVVAESGTALPSDEPAEEIVQVGDQAMVLTAQAAQESPVEADAVAAQRAELSSAGEYQITLVRSSHKSTEQLLGEAYDTPGVISAQPNYVMPASEAYADDADLAAGAADLGQVSAQNVTEWVHEDNAENLSSLQWYLGSGGGTNTLEGRGAPVGMDVPGYDNGAAGTQNSSPNATVAVMDSGMDVTHPDLQGVFYTFSPEQQNKYGCGDHGYNASVARGTEGSGTLTDTLDHGTHVCGIVAAAWDEKGTAGVSNGAKLIGVRLNSNQGMQTAAANIRAFGFLIEIAREVNLKSVNCSWGSDLGFTEFTYTLLVNQLGEQGAITVFAAGNDSADADQQITTGCFVDSPFVLSVGAMTPAGKKAFFSNYGATRTDVFAPGTSILSTVPAYVPANVNSRAYRYYYATSASGVITRQTFGGGDDGGVKVYSENPLDNASAQDVATLANVGTDDNHSLSIARNAFERAPRPESLDGVEHMPGNRVYVKIPVGTSNGSDIAYVSLRHTSDFGPKSYTATLFGFVANTSGGGTKVVDLSKHNDGCYNFASTRANKASWGNSTMSVTHMLAADEEAESVYVGEDHCMIALLEVQELSVDDSTLSNVYIDDVAVGNSEAHPSAHAIFNGTSMAAPTVTGALAVVAKDEPLNSVLSAEDLGLQALERSARLRAATASSGDLNPYCATGGYVNLSGFKNLTSTEDAPLAPIIVAAECSSGSVEAGGYFFGGAIDDVEAYVDGELVSVASWEGDATAAEVSAALPEGIQNGSHVLTLVTASGQDRIAFSYSEDGAGTPALYEEDLPVPNMNADSGENGASNFVANLCVSGEDMYILQRDLNRTLVHLWKYSIADQTWTVCRSLPDGDMQGSGTILAATESGVVLYNQVNDGGSDAGYSLFDYDASNDSWSKRQISSAIPSYAGVFSRGNDLYFVGGSLDDGKQLALSVLREGSDELEILAELPSELKDHASYMTWPVVAVSDRYVYAAGKEPWQGGYDCPWGLVRMKLDENDHVVETKLFTSELADAGIVSRGVVSNIALAGMPCGVAIVGRVDDSTDTRTMKSGSDAISELDRTSTYYESNSQVAAWHDGKLYALGYSPSEPDLMYFRATELNIDHTWDHGTVVTKPSATEPGEMLFTCTACGETRTEPIPPTGTVSYSFTSGSGSSWTKGSQDPLAFRVARNVGDDETFSRFEALLVDDVEVPAGAYTAESGSLIANLLPDYLETLEVGEHSLTAVFDDGKATASFTVKAASVQPDNQDKVTPTPKATPKNEGAKKSPGTGDSLNVWVIVVIVLGVGAAVVAVIARRRTR